jgi:hypothetical protein
MTNDERRKGESTRATILVISDFDILWTLVIGGSFVIFPIVPPRTFCRCQTCLSGRRALIPFQRLLSAPTPAQKLHAIPLKFARWPIRNIRSASDVCVRVPRECDTPPNRGGRTDSPVRPVQQGGCHPTPFPTSAGRSAGSVHPQLVVVSCLWSVIRCHLWRAAHCRSGLTEV